jgi:hypothetical protein
METKDCRITVRMKQEVVHKLQREALCKKHSLSRVICDLLEVYFDEKDSEL